MDVGFLYFAIFHLAELGFFIYFLMGKKIAF